MKENSMVLRAGRVASEAVRLEVWRMDTALEFVADAGAGKITEETMEEFERDLQRLLQEWEGAE